MAMATEPAVTTPSDWSAGTLEKRYFDALDDIRSQYLGWDDDDYILNDADLTDIISRWERRYKDTYDLYIDNEDDIKPAQLSGDSAQDAKVILLRCHRGRWQACCYFGEGGGSAGTPGDDLSANQGSAPQSSADSMADQASGCVASMPTKQSDESVNGVNNTSTPVNSAIEKLANTLERLTTSVEKIALAVEARETREGGRHVVTDGLMASLNKVAQDQTRSSPDEATNNCDSRTSTDYGLGLNTPSSGQDDGMTQSLSSLEGPGFTFAPHPYYAKHGY